MVLVYIIGVLALISFIAGNLALHTKSFTATKLSRYAAFTSLGGMAALSLTLLAMVGLGG